MKRIAGVLALAALAVITAGVLTGCNSRQESGAIGTSGNEAAAPATPAVSSSDRDFVNDLAIASLAERDLGQLAQKQSSNSSVKAFATMMVNDHTAALEKLSKVASERSIAVPTAMDEKHHDLHTKLTALTGSAFDREYMNAMKDGHADVLDKLEARLDKISVKPWKDRLLDTIQGKTDPEPPPVVPEASDDLTTVSLNRWAAEAYPTTYKHHVSAKTLSDSVNRRTQTQ